jgi:hypothetical protein
MTVPRSMNRSASLSAVAALLAVLLSAGAYAHAAEMDAELSIPDEANMRFGAATVAVQDRHRVVISADVTVTGADGRQETRGIIAILIGIVAPAPTGFMDYTDDACLAATSDGTSNTIFLAARARAAIARAWNAHVAKRWPAPPADHTWFEVTDDDDGFAIDVGTSEARVGCSSETQP